MHCGARPHAAAPGRDRTSKGFEPEEAHVSAVQGRCIDPPPEALGAPVPTRCLLPQQCLIATTGGHAIHHDAALQHRSDSSARSAPLLLHNLYLYGGHRGQPGAGAFRWRPEAAQRNASALWASSVTVQGLERFEVESRALFAGALSPEVCVCIRRSGSNACRSTPLILCRRSIAG